MAQTPKLQNVRPDMEAEVALICQGAWICRARDHIGCIICGGYSEISSRTSGGIIFPNIELEKFKAGR